MPAALAVPAVDGVTEMLGWGAVSLVDVDVLGARLLVAARPDPVELADRARRGPAPVTDPWLLELVAGDDPGFLTRPAPVRIVGAVAVRGSWRTARAAAGVFTAFGPRAVLLPEAACRPDVLLAADVAGIGVLARPAAAPGRPRLLVPASPVPPVPRSHVHRLVEEIVHAALLAAR